MITADRYHDISCGHRVHGHESACAQLHGHNYRIHLRCEADTLDQIGRVIDFSVIKAKLCVWLEEHWDHKFLAWQEDTVMREMQRMISHYGGGTEGSRDLFATFVASLVWVPFNPTAENIGLHLLNVIGPRELQGTGARLISVRVEETRKCSAEVTADKPATLERFRP